MKLRFLGGASEVGRIGMLLESENARVVCDYGIAPSDPPQFPVACPPVDYALLSHAHLDHSGMMPWVAREHAVPVLAAPVTQPLAEMLARDSIKIARIEGYTHPYSREDVSVLAGAWEGVHVGDERQLGDLDVRFHNAGHVPGSLMFEMSDASHRVLFTGDLNLVDTRLVKKAEPVRCDTLVMEATYSGRNHRPREETEREFVEAVEEVVADGGTVIVPAFAVGRTQEALMVLADSGLDVWVDGMGKQVAKHMLEEPRSLRSPKELSRAFEAATLVKTPHQRERAVDRADVIVTTSGMMEGGPVVQYLDRVKSDPHSAVFITGYQVEGTGGRTLLDTGRFPFGDRVSDVACKVRKFSFSGHAGHDDLVEFARACRAERVVLFHSDKREPLAKALADDMEVVLPGTGDEVRLD